MATLEHDFRKQDTYLAKDWYKKVILILTKRGAIDGVALNALPQFLKGVTTIISLEVCYAIKYCNYSRIHFYTFINYFYTIYWTLVHIIYTQ